MNIVYLPKATKIDDRELYRDFMKRHMVYQQKLNQALELLKLAPAALQYYPADVVAHAEAIKQRCPYAWDARFIPQYIKDTYETAQVVGGDEYRLFGNQLFRIEWKAKKFKPVPKFGSLFWLDFKRGMRASNSLVFSDHKGIVKPLAQAHLMYRKMKENTKVEKTRASAIQAHLKRGVDDAERFFKHRQAIENIHVGLMYDHGVKVVEEILLQANHILILEPRSMEKSADLMTASGSSFVFDLLRQAAYLNEEINVFEHAIDLALPDAVHDPMRAVATISKYVLANKIFDPKVVETMIFKDRINPDYI